jgi:hypothetical protein
MVSNVTVNASIGIRDKCSVTYLTNADGDIEFSFGSVRPPITLVFDLPALRHFFEQAGNALGDVAISSVCREQDGTAQGEPKASGYLLPSDAGWTEDKVLVADLSHLNSEVGRYVLRQLDVDAGRAEPVSTAYEDDFGQRLITAGERLRYRAVQREVQASGTGPVIEGETAPQVATPQLEHSPDRENGP